jgi:hypothetical protein
MAAEEIAINPSQQPCPYCVRARILGRLGRLEEPPRPGVGPKSDRDGFKCMHPLYWRKQQWTETDVGTDFDTRRRDPSVELQFCAPMMRGWHWWQADK